MEYNKLIGTFDMGELRVSSSLTVKTKVLGGTKDLTDEIKAELMTVGAHGNFGIPW